MCKVGTAALCSSQAARYFTRFKAPPAQAAETQAETQAHGLQTRGTFPRRQRRTGYCATCCERWGFIS